MNHTNPLPDLFASRTDGADPLSAHFTQHRDRLRRLVQLRLDGRVRARLDPSDVLQEAYLDAAARFTEYRENPTMPVFLWLRFLTAQKLLQLHRRHLRVESRDVAREAGPCASWLPEASSIWMASELVAQDPTPGAAAVRAEIRDRVHQSLESMESLDREILALRHFEQLTNLETAQTLGIKEGTASKRYIRALKRMQIALKNLPADPGAPESVRADE